jgi:hypothetical protein
MADKTVKRRDRAAEMAAEMAGLAAPTSAGAGTATAAKTPRRASRAKAPTDPAATTARAPRETARTTAPRTTTRRTAAPVAAMPAETEGRSKYPVRVPLQTSPEQKRALEQARVDDGIQATARLRAMVALWMEDPRIRARVDKLARSFR